MNTASLDSFVWASLRSSVLFLSIKYSPIVGGDFRRNCTAQFIIGKVLASFVQGYIKRRAGACAFAIVER